MICSKCNAEIPETAKFCPACGSSMAQAAAKFCSGCGKQLADGVMFCADCGTPVAQSAPATAPVNAASAPVAEPVMSAAAPVNAAPTPVAESSMPAIGAPVNAAPVSAVPMPVNDTAPAASSIPMPVNDTASVAAPVMSAAPVNAAPVSAVPMPVNDTAPASAVPQPVNSTTGSSFAAASSVAAPVNTQQPSYNVDLNKGGMSAPAADMGFSAASAAVAAPAPKKKSKVGLFVGLGIGAVVVAAGLVIGLGFRGVVANMFMGNNKYAAMIEGNSIKTATQELDVAKADDTLTNTINTAFNSSASMMSAMASVQEDMETIMPDDMDEAASSEIPEELLAMMNFKEILPAYNDLFLQVYGVNSADIKYDIDLDITEAGKSAMGVSGEEFDQLLKFINDMELEMKVTTSKDKLSSYIAIDDGTGFKVDTKALICSDGTVALMFPFSGDKCIAVKLDIPENSTQPEITEIDLSYDKEEMDRITSEIINIYLAYYEKSAVEISGDKTVEVAGISAKGRLISVNMSEQVISDMLKEMVTFLVNDSYITEQMTKVMDMVAETGEDVSYDSFKKEIMDSLDELDAEDIGLGYIVETLVDNNGNILAKTYGIANSDVASANDSDDDGAIDMMALESTPEISESIKVTFIETETEAAAAVLADGKEMLCVKATKKNETDGRLRLTANVEGTTWGINMDYEGVKTEKFGNSEMAVGKYTIYMAGTEESTPDSSMFRVVLQSSVENGTYKASIGGDVSPYGSAAINYSVTPSNEADPAIPSDAYYVDPEMTSEEEAKELVEYLKSFLTDVKAVCDSNPDSMFASVLSPAVDEGLASLDDILNPKVQYEQIYELTDKAYVLSDSIFTVYDQYSMTMDTDSAEELMDLYDQLNDFNSELYEYSEMEPALFADYENRYSELETKLNDLIAKIEKHHNEMLENTVDASEVIGTYELVELYNLETGIPPSQFDMAWTIEIKNDGTFKSTESAYGEEYYTEGEWQILGDVLSLLQDGYVSVELYITDDGLVMGDEDTLRYIFEKR